MPQALTSPDASGSHGTISCSGLSLHVSRAARAPLVLGKRACLVRHTHMGLGAQEGGGLFCVWHGSIQHPAVPPPSLAVSIGLQPWHAAPASPHSPLERAARQAASALRPSPPHTPSPPGRRHDCGTAGPVTGPAPTGSERCLPVRATAAEGPCQPRPPPSCLRYKPRRCPCGRRSMARAGVRGSEHACVGEVLEGHDARLRRRQMHVAAVDQRAQLLDPHLLLQK